MVARQAHNLKVVGSNPTPAIEKLNIKSQKSKLFLMEAINEIKLQGIPIFKQGKVRELYDFDDKLLIIATDRISAFDCILPTGIPEKGEILTELCIFWFNFTKSIISNHLITTDVSEFPEEIRKYEKILERRSMLVKKTEVIPVECVVRGYLSGSGWQAYKENGSICGIKLPGGLLESSKLESPIFTPTTKAETGHDIPLTQSEFEKIVGKETAHFLKTKSIEIYKFASKYAEKHGIIIADTKFEFGKLDDEIILVDELLTPDSSRFWALEDYEPGRAQNSFDKQFVRDYLESLTWDKKPPTPSLSSEIISKTKEKYLEAKHRLL